MSEMSELTPSEKGGPEPADLAELAATDALLDRLGGRLFTTDDLIDSATAALAELLAEIDESRTPDVGAARLVEVLAGRPLYIAGAEALSDTTAQPARTGTEASRGGPEAELPTQRVIDLTDRSVPRDREDPAEETAEDEKVAARTPQVIPIRVPGADRRGRRLPAHVLLPAASVVLLALGGGISAAVTGDPMTPVNGISRVMAALPGVSDKKTALAAVTGEISAADRAAALRNTTVAAQHLDAARRGLGDLDEADQTHLTRMIENVETRLGTTDASPSASPPLPGNVPTTEPATEPSADPEPGTDPTSDPVTPAEPTTEPSADPEPTAAQPTPGEVESTPETVGSESEPSGQSEESTGSGG